MFRNRYINFIQTSCSWDKFNDNLLYVSYISPIIKTYDIETGQSCCEYSYEVEKTGEPRPSQRTLTSTPSHTFF